MRGLAATGSKPGTTPGLGKSSPKPGRGLGSGGMISGAVWKRGSAITISRADLGAWITVSFCCAGLGSAGSGGLGGGGATGMLVAPILVTISGTVPVTVSPATRIAPIAA